MEPFVPLSAKTVLDVGCLAGAFGQYLKAKRPEIEVWGVEPRPDAASVARNNLDVVIEGTFPEDAPDRQFDCVVFNDVLEHMVDPWGALGATRALLRPGGRVVASLPNVRHYYVVGPLVVKGQWEYKGGILDPTHLRFFTPSSMRDLFEGAGFAVDVLAELNVTKRGGRFASLLHLTGRIGRPFLVEQYVVVARGAD